MLPQSAISVGDNPNHNWSPNQLSGIYKLKETLAWLVNKTKPAHHNHNIIKRAPYKQKSVKGPIKAQKLDHQIHELVPH